MGLFGKKEKIPEGIRVIYYEGELPGFTCNCPCQLLLTDDVLRITKISPYIEVKLNRERINSVELYSEQQYMQRFKENNGPLTKKGDIPKAYYVINYMDKEGNAKHLDFWAVSFEASKMGKLKDEINKNQKSTSYEI